MCGRESIFMFVRSSVLDQACFHVVQFFISDQISVVSDVLNLCAEFNSTDAGVPEKFQSRHKDHGFRGVHNYTLRGCIRRHSSEHSSSDCGEDLFHLVVW